MIQAKLPAIDLRPRAKPLALKLKASMARLALPPMRIAVGVDLGASARDRLAALEEMIDAAAAALESGDDYGPEYLAPTKSAQATAKDIAKRLARIGLERLGGMIPPPDIGPTAAGGVDLHWKSDRAELLMGVPSEVGASISFYGDTPSGETIKGRFPVNDGGDFLAAWLLQRA